MGLSDGSGGRVMHWYDAIPIMLWATALLLLALWIRDAWRND